MNKRDVYQEHSAMVDVLEEIDQMFTALDEYRKTKDKRKLFKVHDLECRSRKKMKAIESMMQAGENKNSASDKAA